jgi:hypothetical protein
VTADEEQQAIAEHVEQQDRERADPEVWNAAAAAIPQEWEDAACDHYSMHGNGLVRNILAGVEPLIRADERKRVADEGRPFDRERLGRMVREIWVATARAHPDPKPSWLVPWDELGEWDKEVDRRIGEAVASHAALVTAIETHQVGSRERAALIRQRDLAMTEAAKLRAKLAAIEDHCRKHVQHVQLHCPDLGRPAYALVEADKILAVIDGEG